LSANVRDRDFVFLGTSFMGLKELIDPHGKYFGGSATK